MRLFGLASPELSVLGCSHLPADEFLLDWASVDSNSKLLRSYLALDQVQAPLEHTCPDPCSLSCHYRSPSGHIRRSISCPQVNANPKLFSFGEGHAEPDGTLEVLMSSPSWRAQVRMDARTADLSRYQYGRISRDVFDRVLVGRATPDELWILDGILFRAMFRNVGVYTRQAYAYMWACVYRARRGFHLPAIYFASLERASRAILDEHPTTELVHHNRTCQYAFPWSEFLLTALDERKRWVKPFDVFHGVTLRPDELPAGTAIEEWAGDDTSSSSSDSESEVDEDDHGHVIPLIKQGMVDFGPIGGVTTFRQFVREHVADDSFLIQDSPDGKGGYTRVASYSETRNGKRGRVYCEDVYKETLPSTNGKL